MVQLQPLTDINARKLLLMLCRPVSLVASIWCLLVRTVCFLLWDHVVRVMGAMLSWCPALLVYSSFNHQCLL